MSAAIDLSGHIQSVPPVHTPDAGLPAGMHQIISTNIFILFQVSPVWWLFLKGVLIDIGGVCVSYPYSVMADVFQRRFGTDREKALRILREEAVAFDLGSITVREFCSNVSKRLELSVRTDEFTSLLDSSIMPDQEVLSLLDRIRNSNGWTVVALSNMPEYTWNMLKRSYGFDTLFDDAVLSYEVGTAKPERRMFEIAVEVAGLPASECVFIDDAPENVRAAQRFGLISHLFRTVRGLADFLAENGAKVY